MENRRRPSILALSRQNLPNLAGTSIEGVAKGAYIVHGGDEKPDAIVLATGAWPHLSSFAAFLMDFRHCAQVLQLLPGCVKINAAAATIRFGKGLHGGATDASQSVASR